MDALKDYFLPLLALLIGGGGVKLYSWQTAKLKQRGEKVDVDEKEIKSLRERLDIAVTENEQLRQTNRDMQARMLKMESDMNEMHKQIEALSAQVVKLTTEGALKEAEQKIIDL